MSCFLVACIRALAGLPAIPALLPRFSVPTARIPVTFGGKDEPDGQ